MTNYQMADHLFSICCAPNYQEADLLLSSCYADRYQEVAAFGSSRRDLLLSRLFIKQGTRLSFAPEIER